VKNQPRRRLPEAPRPASSCRRFPTKRSAETAPRTPCILRKPRRPSEPRRFRAEKYSGGATRFPGLGTAKGIRRCHPPPWRKGEVTGPARWCLRARNGKAIIASVTDVQPAHPASFEEAKAEVHNKASQEKLNKLLDGKAQRTGGPRRSRWTAIWQKAAKSMGIEVKTSPRCRPPGRHRVGGDGLHHFPTLS